MYNVKEAKENMKLKLVDMPLVANLEELRNLNKIEINKENYDHI